MSADEFDATGRHVVIETQEGERVDASMQSCAHVNPELGKRTAAVSATLRFFSSKKRWTRLHRCMQTAPKA